MSEEIYLKRVELQQFRSFEKLTLDLAPEPSVLIVHGSNGLGKSSLFDAMEWALTGSIDHFKGARGAKKPGTYLCRWRTDSPGPTSAALNFSDGQVVERSLKSAKAKAAILGGTVPDVTEYLRSGGWKQSISSLDSYLLLTHFLGQANASRITHREDDERFEMLKEAAQSGGMEAIAYTLFGDGRRPAAKAFNRQIETLDREAKTVRDLVLQEGELWEAAQSAGAIGDADGILLATRIVGLLGPFGDDAVVALDSAALDDLQGRLSRAHAEARRGASRLERARQLLDEANRQRVAIAQAEAAMENAAAEARRLGADVPALEHEVAVRASETAAALSSLTAARTAHSRLVELSQLVSDAAAARTAESAAASTMSVAEVEFQRADLELRHIERRKAIVERLRLKMQEADQSLTPLHARARAVQDAIELSTAVRSETAALNLALSLYPDLDGQIRRVEAAYVAAKQADDVQGRLVSALEASTRSISAAVSVIAHDLPADACECPVCATTFGDAGLLRARVEDAAERLAPALNEQQRIAEATKAALDTASSERDSLMAASSEIRGREPQLAADRSRLSALIGRFGIDNSADDSAARLSVVEHDIEAELSATSWRIGRWTHWSDVIGRGLRGVLDEARRAYDEARREREAAVRSQSESSKRVAMVTAQTAVIAAAAFGAEDAYRGKLLSATESAADRLAADQARYGSAAAAERESATKLTAARSANAAADALLGRLSDGMKGADEGLDRVLAEWVSLGFEGPEPDPADIETATVAGNTVAADLGEAEDVLRRLREGREAWRRQEAHRDALERLRVALDAAPHFDRAQLRAAADQLANEKENLAVATRRASETAKAASDGILAELQSFNAEYIVPLDRLTKQINLAILCDPAAGIDLRVKDRRIEQTATKSGKVPDEIGDIDPALVHSEGQMSALAVSMLCAASLTYPWSRWRALVLDDPLQHNDAIHAAAFADLVGNLVIEQRYQILLTTHDLAQSQFLQRKFESRRIPCTMLQLLGQGRGGVDYEYREARNSFSASASAIG
jgi:hypothetical protein